LRNAIAKNGLNPIKLGLFRSPSYTAAKASGISDELIYANWKNQVAQDRSDWNLCDACMTAIRPYLEGPTRPTGTTIGAFTPDMQIIRAAAAQLKKQAEVGSGTTPKKPWWKIFG
jgi:hypothetical protein